MHQVLNALRQTGRFLLLLLVGSTSLAAQDLPNIVIIYADDLGYGDLSCYNPKAAYETPRLDRMAREGIRFTDAHSPSTACIHITLSHRMTCCVGSCRVMSWHCCSRHS